MCFQLRHIFSLDTRRLRVAVNTPYSWDRKNGHSNFPSYSPKLPVSPENDVESLEDRLQGGDLSVSLIERKARGPDVIREERREKQPLHYAIIGQSTLDISTTIKSFYDKAPASIHVPDD
ncbi:hypothetical protein EV421DRAFT_1733469 [Armillaria borealis]|uniref:Uncharacterized protein n=1 Tax=Armillaria borealis TaxID=47425 RepID=A0AA39JRW0_9AGAR|nr:hypothetical protein EV421DRAFT_1733469 [Armillaria borealis]